MSTLNCLGMPVESPTEMTNLILTALKTAQTRGRYQVWSCSSGAQLWIKTSQEGKIMGFTPHFEGKARARIRLQQAVPEHSFYSWAGVDDESDPSSGMYPFVFESPNPANLALDLPALVDVQLCAFGLESYLRQDELEMKNSGDWDADMAAESCIPCGLFSPDGTPTDPPEPVGMYVGRVLDWARHTNTLTGLDFYWVHLATLGCQLDVVLPLNALARDPKAGNLLSGVFYLTGILGNG